MSRVDLVDFTWGLINVTIWTSIEAYWYIPKKRYFSRQNLIVE